MADCPVCGPIPSGNVCPSCGVQWHGQVESASALAVESPLAHPQVLATPDGWVRLDEAGKPVEGTGLQQCLGTGMQQAQEHGTFPPLTFRPEEWRMPSVAMESMREVAVDPTGCPVLTGDDIMSAVRTVARGS